MKAVVTELSAIEVRTPKGVEQFRSDRTLIAELTGGHLTIFQTGTGLLAAFAPGCWNSFNHVPTLKTTTEELR